MWFEEKLLLESGIISNGKNIYSSNWHQRGQQGEFIFHMYTGEDNYKRYD